MYIPNAYCFKLVAKCPAQASKTFKAAHGLPSPCRALVEMYGENPVIIGLSLRDHPRSGFSPTVGGLLTIGTKLYTSNLCTHQTRFGNIKHPDALCCLLCTCDKGTKFKKVRDLTNSTLRRAPTPYAAWTNFCLMSPARRHESCQFFSPSVQGFRIPRGSKISNFPQTSVITLTTVLRTNVLHCEKYVLTYSSWYHGTSFVNFCLDFNVSFKQVSSNHGTTALCIIILVRWSFVTHHSSSCKLQPYCNGCTFVFVNRAAA